LKGRVGLFGGTFNPVHNAHLVIAGNALRQFGLSQVVFVPNGTPPDRPGESRPAKEDRYRMVEEAVDGREGFSVSRIEVDRDGPSYTIDTIRALKDDYPQGICFVIGADSLLRIETWKEPEAVIASVSFVVAPRKGVSLSAFQGEPFDEASIHVLNMPEVDVSSTFLRTKARHGESIAAWVPARVATYIEEHGLYRDAEEA
jgi:nicotinate-nucleotide adenylyltransferase